MNLIDYSVGGVPQYDCSLMTWFVKRMEKIQYHGNIKETVTLQLTKHFGDEFRNKWEGKNTIEIPKRACCDLYWNVVFLYI